MEAQTTSPPSRLAKTLRGQRRIIIGIIARLEREMQAIDWLAEALAVPDGMDGGLIGDHLANITSSDTVLTLHTYGDHRHARMMAAAIWADAGVHVMARRIAVVLNDTPLTTYTIKLETPIAGFDTICVDSYTVPETCRIEYSEQTVRVARTVCE